VLRRSIQTGVVVGGRRRQVTSKHGKTHVSQIIIIINCKHTSDGAAVNITVHIGDMMLTQ